MNTIHIRSVFINDMRTKEEPSAEEMFIDLDFKQVINNESVIEYVYIYNNDFHISFDKKYKVINGNQTYDYVCDYKMLQAINKQVEELGWNK